MGFALVRLSADLDLKSLHLELVTIKFHCISYILLYNI